MSFDKIFDLTAEVYFYFQVSWDFAVRSTQTLLFTWHIYTRDRSYHTQLAKMSFGKIFVSQLECYFIFIIYTVRFFFVLSGAIVTEGFRFCSHS